MNKDEIDFITRNSKTQQEAYSRLQKSQAYDDLSEWKQHIHALKVVYKMDGIKGLWKFYLAGKKLKKMMKYGYKSDQKTISQNKRG